MRNRRQRGRVRDIVSFGRRTPRVNFEAVRSELASLASENIPAGGKIVEFPQGSVRAERSPRAGLRH